jgi:hypothetical protein
MEISTTASKPFEKYCLDVVGPLTETQKGNRYILTFQDELSKFLVAIPIARQDSERIAKELVMNIILKIGTPDKILTDQGSNILSEVFKDTYKILKIQTTPVHPKSNRGLERCHRVLKNTILYQGGSDKLGRMDSACRFCL